MGLWEKERVLGRGGFGVVSLASTASDDCGDVRLPPFIAVKSWLYSHSLDDEYAFLRLFKDCRNVIRCFGLDVTLEDDNLVYSNLLLEYASGGSLMDCISEKGMQEFQVRTHTKSVLLGLTHIHAKGIVHCDIKPHNILLVDQVAKIADFGLAMTLEQCCRRDIGHRGTATYMAPESVVKKEYGEKVDIWALGCTVYEMLTGKPLWGSDEDAEGVVFDRIALEEPNYENDKLCEEARDFLKKCLAKNPNSRWTADMLLEHPFVSLKLKIPISQKKTRERQISNISNLQRPYKKRAFKIQPPVRELIIIDP